MALRPARFANGSRSRQPRGVKLVAAALALSTLPPVAAGVAAAISAGPASALTPTCASVGIGLTNLGGPNFYIDASSTPAFTGGYTGYSVTNNTGYAMSDIWVQIANFNTGSVLSLAGNQPASEQIASLANGASTPLFWFLSASAQSNSSQTYVVTVFDHNPALADSSALCTLNDGYASVQGALGANANKITSISIDQSAPTLGSAFTITVVGSTGTIGSGLSNDPGSFWMSPAAMTTWPANDLRLESTTLNISPDGVAAAQTYNNILRLANIGSASRNYTATYTFQAVGPTASSTSVQPEEEIASGTQIKHTSSYPSTIPPIGAISNTMSVAISSSPSKLGTTGGTVGYTATLSGPPGASVDGFLVKPPSSAGFTSGSATFNGSNIPDPSTNSSGDLVFTGPFTLPATSASSTSASLQFSLTYGATPGNQTTSVQAVLGSTLIGTTSSSSTAATTTVNVDTPPTTVLGTTTVSLSGGSVTIPVTNWASDVDGDPLTVTSVSGANVSLAGGTVTYTPPGSGSSDSFTYTVSDGRGGTAQGTVDVNLTNETVQTITASGPGNVSISQGTANVTASASSGLTVVFSSVNTSICTVDQTGSVTLVAAGTCQIDVDQPGNGTYAPASTVTVSFSVTAAAVIPSAQTISFASLSGMVAGGQVNLTATATSGLNVAFSVLTSSTCSLGSGTDQLSALAIGTCTVEASQPGDGSWSAATPVDRSLTIAGAPQAITAGTLSDEAVGSTEALTSIAASSLAVTYTSETPSTCSIDAAAGTLTGTSAGTCSVLETQAGNSYWAAAAPVTQTVQVLGTAQTVTFPVPAGIYTGATTLLTASASSGLPVTYTSTSPSVCTVQNATVTGVSAGTCDITASQAGGTVYNPASATASFSILAQPQQAQPQQAQPQQVLATPPPASISGSAGAVDLAGSATSGLPVAYSSQTPGTCSVSSSGTVTFLVAGTCSVTLSQGGNSQYDAAATQTDTFQIKPISQAITVSAPPEAATAGASPSLGASATSGLTPIYTSVTPSVCSTRADGQLTLLAGGTCTVDVSQGGGGLYSAAAQAQVTFAVAREPQVITVGTSVAAGTSAAVGTGVQGAPGTGAHALASASSGLAITYESLTPEVCHAGATGAVRVQSSGTCTVLATQAGNQRWLPASARSSFKVVASPARDIQFSLPSHALDGAAPVKLDAHGSVGATFTYQVSAASTSQCWTSRASLYLPRAGSCTVKAVQTADNRSATATVTVVGARPLVVTAQPADGRPQTVPVQVISSGQDGIRLAGLGTPSDGRAWTSGDRALYSPPTAFTGSVTFAYRLIDSLGRQASSTVTVIVPNAAPTVSPAHVSQTAGSALYLPLKAHDWDADRLSVSVRTGKALDVKIVGTGLVLRPALWSSGLMRTWVSVTDSSGGTAGAWITDVVSPRPATGAHWALRGARQTTISWS
ncbi:MAG TPA: cadherin-like domain-containing protein, partial [Acidimicrobiales bacterium]|nr:cadherin-like domain-containing protein [Acidimicrobiales bacterium]